MPGGEAPGVPVLSLPGESPRWLRAGGEWGFGGGMGRAREVVVGEPGPASIRPGDGRTDSDPGYGSARLQRAGGGGGLGSRAAGPGGGVGWGASSRASGEDPRCPKARHLGHPFRLEGLISQVPEGEVRVSLPGA